ncbi:MAG: HAMP domain-containing protein [Pseudonocardiaceae bacterium]|nr:HAMP domain-containing protein [Pseudonocardiaceae bacterium]
MSAQPVSATQPSPSRPDPLDPAALERILQVLEDLRDGNFRRRLVVTDASLTGRIATVINQIAQRNQSLVGELVRVREAVGQDGRTGERLADEGDAGWALAAGAINGLIDDLTRPTTELARVLAAVSEGDLSSRVSDQLLRGDFARLGHTVNGLLDQLSLFAAEVTRVAREVGTEGRLGGQADVPGVAGTWRDLTESVNVMAGNLTAQVRDIAQVATAVARGDLSRKITVEVSGELLELKDTLNTMVDQLSAFAAEVTRVAREVGSEGRLGGQAQVPGVAGTWRDLTDSVNVMAGNLTGQVRSIAQVATAVARGDLSRKITVDARGEILELKNTLNTMVDQLSAFADEVTRVAHEVGSEGQLGGQATVRGVDGTWKALTDNVNGMAENLTSQVRSIAKVATAVAGGDLSKKITIEARGEVAALAETINRMVDTLGAFADEVTRVAREVGTEGTLGGQARVPNVAGTWKALTDNVNFMANNLTSQVRNIAQVTTAVASGDLSKKIDVDARGEILELKTTINTMVDRLSAFGSEVTRVAREVGTEGKLGGQAEVIGVSGTWERLTENVNRLAGNLTTQVRAIAAVATAVTAGDLTRQITVDASGEVAELKDNINRMIATLGETTRANQDQGWLKTNLAQLSGLMQGHRDLSTVASLVLSELAPLVSAQQGAFFLVRADGDGSAGPVVEFTAGYGIGNPAAIRRFALGESLVGQAALDKRTILVTEAPPDYAAISSGLGHAAPTNLLVLPLLFEDQALGVIELASVNEFTAVHRDLLEQLRETIGVNVNTILANSRTEALLAESQRLAQELTLGSQRLQAQQHELQKSNTELAEKAALLATQNRAIEIKNVEIELARQEIEERAAQLAAASRYKSDFMANMSHELRTPLNSALVLAKLLADNLDSNLTDKQVEFARTIHSAGSDLLQLINDILDLAKVEAGRMDPSLSDVAMTSVVNYVKTLCEPLAAEKALHFTVELDAALPETLHTDEQRLQQVLRNLMSNAVKFTDEGGVLLRIRPASADEVEGDELRAAPARVAFEVEDTGIGIPADKLTVIFDAFQQADGTTSRRYGGTGLGLSISRQLTQLLGGELVVRSEPGVGSVFTLYLPEVAEPSPPAVPDRTTQDILPDKGAPPELVSAARSLPQLHTARDEAPPRFHGESILIVDDDLRNVFALSSMLEAHGLQVFFADNGVAGVRALERHEEIALVLMDVMMPELDGNATIAAIRNLNRYADLPIIAVTAKAMKEDRAKSLASGANDYVTKPVDTDLLLRLIHTHLNSPSDALGHTQTPMPR